MGTFTEELFKGSGFVHFNYLYTPEYAGDLETPPEKESVDIYEVITEQGEEITDHLSDWFISQQEQRILEEKYR